MVSIDYLVKSTIHMMWYKNGKNRDFTTSIHRHNMAVISQMIFSNTYLEWKCLYLIQISLKHISRAHQYDSIASDHDLAPNRRPTIIWYKGGLVYWRKYASPALNDFMWKHIWFIVAYVLFHLYSLHSTNCCINIYLHDMSSQWKRHVKICIHQGSETVMSRMIKGFDWCYKYISNECSCSSI